MTEKRFELKSVHFKKLDIVIYDRLNEKELHLSIFEVVDLLNDVSQTEFDLHRLREYAIQKLDEMIAGDVE
jgi:hypothetical protein